MRREAEKLTVYAARAGSSVRSPHTRMPNSHHRSIISLVAAMAENRAIGRDHGLPWRLPADMRHFVALTRGKPIVMGRRCHEAIGRALPGRQNIVLSRNHAFRAPGCTVVHGLESALAATAGAPEIMAIGGEQLYRLFLARADRIYLTLVHASIDGDTFFPQFDGAEWREAGRQQRPADADNSYAMTFLTLLKHRTGDDAEAVRAGHPGGLLSS